MKESEAWLFLAGKWDHPSNHTPDSCTVPGGVWGVRMLADWPYQWQFGLCQCVPLVMVSVRIVNRMRGRLLKRRPKGAIHNGYWWPLDLEGAATRARVCRDLAAEAAAEEAKARGIDTPAPTVI